MRVCFVFPLGAVSALSVRRHSRCCISSMAPNTARGSHFVVRGSPASHPCCHTTRATLLCRRRHVCEATRRMGQSSVARERNSILPRRVAHCTLNFNLQTSS